MLISLVMFLKLQPIYINMTLAYIAQKKTFTRSDDDPFSNNYYGVSNFNSISDRAAINLVDYLGLENNDNSFYQ